MNIPRIRLKSLDEVKLLSLYRSGVITLPDGEAPVEIKSKPSAEKKTPEAKPFVLSAWDYTTGKMMDIDEYCTHYNLPRQDIVEYKLVTHTGSPFYNTRFKECDDTLELVDYEKVKRILSEQIKKDYTPSFDLHNANKEGVLKWADLHCGAHIRNLLLTKDYDSDILERGLLESVREVNTRNYSRTHVHILGDLIESFSGRNHVNSWMSMNKDEIGATVVKLCSKKLGNALRNVKNLGKVFIIGGNHDRLSVDNDEDVKGGAAELIAWGLELMGFDVEFHPYITTHRVEGINHINLHGDKGISKRSTEKILWEYGEKGCFNFIFEAHLHSIIQKLSTKERENFKTIKDDSIDHRRMHLASFFTGNYYSETLGYTSNAGYTIVDDNGKGVPNVFMGSI